MCVWLIEKISILHCIQIMFYEWILYCLMFYDVYSDYNNVDLLFWIDVLLVFACNLNSKAASHLFCNLSYSENEPWGHCIFGTLHSSCWMSRLQNIEALPLADFLSELWECVDHIKFICVNNIREYIFIGIIYRIQHW